MRKTIFGCLGVAAVAFALQFTTANAQFFNRCDPCDRVACDPCDRAWDCDPCGPLNGCSFNGCDFNGCNFNGCGPTLGKWFFKGHVEAGAWANAHGSTGSWGNSGYLMNTGHTGLQANQIYFSAGRSVDGRRGLDLGGTVDFAYGSDVWMAQACGLEFTHSRNNWSRGDYHTAFPQVYAEAAFNRVNVKAGKFYVPFGLDSFKSTDNFFYSWSPAKMIVPTTAGGVVTTFRVNDRLSVMGGFVQPDAFGCNEFWNSYIGGFTVKPTQRLSIRYSFLAGDKNPEFVNSLTTTFQINRRLAYSFDWSLWNGGEGVAGWYSLMNEVTFQANQRWAFGTRFGMTSWDGTSELDMYTISLGANWTPNNWLTVKPEVRWDWAENSDVTNFANGDKSHQFSGGLSAVVKF